MKLAARVSRIAPSPTLAMAAKAKSMVAQGVDVVDFSAGEPDFDTPEPVKAAAEDAIRSGFTKYTPSSGIDELRGAIADKLQAEVGVRYDKSQVLVSCGAKHSLYNLAEALLEAGGQRHARLGADPRRIHPAGPPRHRKSSGRPDDSQG